MNLNAAAARALAKALPTTIRRRLFDDDEFVLFADWSVLSYGEAVSFRHVDVLAALERAQTGGGGADLSSRSGERFALRRSEDGRSFTLIDSSGNPFRTSEFGFLAPDVETRLFTLSEAEKQCWPKLPTAGPWREILRVRALTEIELARLITDLRETPGQFLASIERSLANETPLTYEDLFPESMIYCRAFVGSPPANEMNEWIMETLVPDLASALDVSVADGLRRCLALNIDPRLSPVHIARNVPSGNLLAVLDAMPPSNSPIGLFGILELALDRIEDGDRFIEIAADVLDRLFGPPSKSQGAVAVWKMTAAFARAALRKLSVSEELLFSPPCWRRLAAHAHAHALVDLLSFQPEQAADFVEWLDKSDSGLDSAALFVDMWNEPLWRTWELTARRIKASMVARLSSSRELLEARGLWESVAVALDDLKSENGLLDLEMPGPLSRTRTRLGAEENRASTDSDPVAEQFARAAEKLSADPTGDSWSALSETCRLLRFDENLLSCLTLVTGRASVGEGREGKDRFLEALLLAADVAAVQGCTPLADALASALVREARSFDDPSAAVAGLRALLIAAASFTNAPQRMDWLETKLSEYAFSVPKGKACRWLLLELGGLDRLIPLKERRFARARKFLAAGLG